MGEDKAEWMMLSGTSSLAAAEQQVQVAEQVLVRGVPLVAGQCYQK
jgi:hypothetical protein